MEIFGCITFLQSISILLLYNPTNLLLILSCLVHTIQFFKIITQLNLFGEQPPFGRPLQMPGLAERTIIAFAAAAGRAAGG